MATKQELEVQVAELQKRLDDLTASGTTVDVAPAVQGLTDAEVEALVQKVKDEYEAKLTQLSVEKNLQADIAQKASDRVDELTAQLRVLTPSKKTAPLQEGVVLDGVPHVIIQRERAVDLVTAWRGRFVDDDDLVLVVKKA